MPPPSIWIVGAGRFGRMAVDRLGQRFGRQSLLLVDPDPLAQPFAAERGVALASEDGPAFLHRRLRPDGQVEWIVPALPLHLAWEWIRRRLSACRGIVPLEVPEAAVRRLPNVLSGPDGALYTSNADFRCPEDCPEPARRCTVTGRPRPRVLHSHIAGIEVEGWTVTVVTSRQLAPGVGGIAPHTLFEALERLSFPGRHLVATACKCHGVVHAVSVTESDR